MVELSIQLLLTYKLNMTVWRIWKISGVNPARLVKIFNFTSNTNTFAVYLHHQMSNVFSGDDWRTLHVTNCVRQAAVNVPTSDGTRVFIIHYQRKMSSACMHLFNDIAKSCCKRNWSSLAIYINKHAAKA